MITIKHNSEIFEFETLDQAMAWAKGLGEFAAVGDSLVYCAGLLNNFAISAENIGNVADQIVDGIQYQVFVLG
jgi:hypothetical protein